MQDQITTVYVICDEVLRLLNIQDDPQSLMSNAEVITFSIFAAREFAGNHKKARWYFKQLNYFPNILSNSRLNRRLHNFPFVVWNSIFRFLAFIFSKKTPTYNYAVDSFPVFCCQKSRIDRRKIFLGKEYIGYAASKRKYFCGLKIHMLVSTHGEPYEVLFRPASENDLSALWKMELQIPRMSNIYADGAYNCFELEDLLQADGINLLVKRGKKIKNRRHSQEKEREISSRRQIIETAFSCITSLFPRSFRVRTDTGLILRVFSAILAYSFSFIY